MVRSRLFREDDLFRKKIVGLAFTALKMELDADTRNEIENLKKAYS